ncbi:MAG TPA: alpha/beta hydrolase-fold protein [Thermoanaerobaculia bacterium]|nr:alpha/beta hydrolase-fold protein [Thermoanaerobaculia bacterium]
MIRRLVTVYLLLFCVGKANADQAVTIGKKECIRSTVLNEDREYQVYLPDSYGWATDRRYPVLYVLDGKTHFAHTAGSVGFLAAQGEIPEMIVVAVASTVRVRDFTQTDWPSMWVGGGGANNFKRFLSSELIPNINQTYRTDGFQILSGHSSGGQFALYCLTAQPSLFQAYFALSPNLSWDDNLPQRSLEKSFESAPNLPAFLYFAYSDDSDRALADDNRLVETLRTKSPRGFRWHSQTFSAETHGSVPLLAQIDALRHLYAGYRFHNDMLRKGFAFAEQHFKDVSKTLGWSLAIPENVINSFGYAALSEGKTQDAIALFKRNVEANPNSANAYDSLADGYAKAGEWKEAARAARRAVALATKFNDPNLSSFIANETKITDRLKEVSTAPE